MSVKIQMLKTLKEKKCLDDLKTLKNKKQLASLWFKELRDKICKSFEEIDNDKTIKEKTAFTKKSWERDGGGGGVISIMHGNIFEKVGVNISTVHGKFSKEFRQKIPGAEENGLFWASGISVVSHMCNPHVPAAHMNTRMLVTGNGDKKKIELSQENASLSKALDSMGYKPNTVVVELNDLIINSKKWDKVILKDGDNLEIVSIVGGG